MSPERQVISAKWTISKDDNPVLEIEYTTEELASDRELNGHYNFMSHRRDALQAFSDANDARETRAVTLKFEWDYAKQE